MSQAQITEKLNRLFDTHPTLEEESHVIYVMVEIRKVIDQTKSAAKYPLLKFYSDWAVHSKKDRITPEIEKISEDMYAFAVSEINAPYPGMSGSQSEVLEFAYMNGLGKEMAAFFAEFGIGSDMPTDKDKWTSFVSLLVKVLEEQPIVDPSQNVASIMFEPANNRCVILLLTFKLPVKGNHWYRMMNAY